MGDGKRLLLVDDDPSVRAWLRIDFTQQGFEVFEASSGEEALMDFEEVAPDVVVTDQVMGGITGVQTAMRLRRRGFTGPVILVSSFLTKPVARQAQALDVHPVSKLDRAGLLRVLTAATAPV